MEILYSDRRILVAVKPCGVLSTDEPGGMPELLRQALGDSNACVRTVHRLDRVVGGVMVFARSRMAASILSEQMRKRQFCKQYLAVVHGLPEPANGQMTNLLLRDTYAGRTTVVQQMAKGVQEAELSYQVLAHQDGLSLVKITLGTGRTHQIRVQFASRGLPLAGDRKYGRDDGCPIGLWSCGLQLLHPQSGEAMQFFSTPPRTRPWVRFAPEDLAAHS